MVFQLTLVENPLVDFVELSDEWMKKKKVRKERIRGMHVESCGIVMCCAEFEGVFGDGKEVRLSGVVC